MGPIREFFKSESSKQPANADKSGEQQDIHKGELREVPQTAFSRLKALGSANNRPIGLESSFTASRSMPSGCQKIIDVFKNVANLGNGFKSPGQEAFEADVLTKTDPQGYQGRVIVLDRGGTVRVPFQTITDMQRLGQGEGSIGKVQVNGESIQIFNQDKEEVLKNIIDLCESLSQDGMTANEIEKFVFLMNMNIIKDVMEIDVEKYGIPTQSQRHSGVIFDIDSKSKKITFSCPVNLVKNGELSETDYLLSETFRIKETGHEPVKGSLTLKPFSEAD